MGKDSNDRAEGLRPPDGERLVVELRPWFGGRFCGVYVNDKHVLTIDHARQVRTQKAIFNALEQPGKGEGDMMDRKVTDLEKFALKQVYRPMMPFLVPDWQDHPRGWVPGDWKLANAVNMLKKHAEWREHVMDRIARCDFMFPTYINHPLVDYIREWSASCQCSESYEPCAWCLKDTEGYDKAVMNGNVE